MSSVVDYVLSNKIPLILAAAASNYVIWTPPNPPAPKNRHVRLTPAESVFRTIVRTANFSSKFLSTAAFLAEAAVIYARNNPSSPLSKHILSLLIFRGASSTSEIRVTRPFIIGSALTIIGGLMRLSCYRTLGRLFTYELSILKDHQLITSGLYSYVRHPSYLAYSIALVGLWSSHMTRGSWIVESGLLNTGIGRSLVGLWHSWALYLWSQVFTRAVKEDTYLREEFGQQWVEWQKRVPYRVFPGLF